MKNFEQMTTEEKQDHWAQLESILRSVIKEVGFNGNHQLLEQVEEFLDNNELGLAFESIIDLLSQKNYRPALSGLLMNVGKRLGYDRLDNTNSEIEIWKRLLSLYSFVEKK